MLKHDHLYVQMFAALVLNSAQENSSILQLLLVVGKQVTGAVRTHNAFTQATVFCTNLKLLHLSN